jgi:hypothetical protein
MTTLQQEGTTQTDLPLETSALSEYLVCADKRSIGIEQTNAGIGIPASTILFRYRTQKVPD